jgi:glutamine amidotransferase
MFNGINQNEDFYFVHSYAFACDSPEVVVATSEYGVTFPVSIYQEPVWGVQFHPEKSSKAGMQLLSNFSRFCKC